MLLDVEISGCLGNYWFDELEDTTMLQNIIDQLIAEVLCYTDFNKIAHITVEYYPVKSMNIRI